MDKLYNNPWFVKVISFLIAIMLFIIVNYDNVSNTQPGALPTITSGSYTLEEVPLNVYYNEEEHVITEVAKHVQVNLRGPQNVLTLLQIARPSYDVFVDLRNLGPGTHNVEVQDRSFPNELTVNVEPSTVKVTIEEKRTVSIPVEIDLLNTEEVQEGYTVGTPIVNPVYIEVTSAASIIENVAFAKGFVDVIGVEETIEKSVPVKVYDQQGNELHIDVNPSVVDVKIPITSPNKDVPLKINRIGELQKGLSIRTIYSEPTDVTIYGPKEVINDISFIEGINIDLSKITEKSTFDIEVPIPEGVEKVAPATVKVVVEVDIEENLEIENVPVEVIGLSERMDVAFSNQENKQVNVIVKGAPASIERIRKEDIKVYIDVNQLAIGEHSVPIQVNGPQNITFKMPYNEVKIIISQVLGAEEEVQNEDQAA